MKIKIRLGDADADRTVFIKSRQQGLSLIFEEYKKASFYKADKKAVVRIRSTCAAAGPQFFGFLQRFFIGNTGLARVFVRRFFFLSY